MAEPDNIPATIPEEEDTPQPTLEQLNALHASATKEYSLKNYSLAAELYSEATEIQAQLNGEMNPENADLLYQYGRCLYHVAVSKSDVLGGKVASSSNEPAKKKPKTKSTKDDKPVETTVNETKSAPQKETDNTTNKPFFQITGDENWTDSEPDDDDDDAEDVDDAAQDAQDEQDEDDFAIAYEILDVARVLLTRKLDSLSQQSSSNNTNGTKGKAREIPPEQTPQGKQIMERLADTHDLQAEISLENERFADAVADEKASLELKLRIFPQESSLVAEAHYKLSLALEFASVTQTTATTTTTTDGAANETEAAGGEEAQVDEVMREEAVQHMESAIASCKLRVDKETASLASLSPEQKREKEASIKDVTEMIGDMEQRVRFPHPFPFPLYFTLADMLFPPPPS